jgi:processive 1,2-diacylglycerol beta-glucosyltransferase
MTRVKEGGAMRVAFFSVSAGQGHNQAAKVVIEYLKEHNIQCVMLDIFEYINPILSESVVKGYLVSTRFTPSVYGKLYRMAERREKSNGKFSITNLTNSILSKKLTTFISEYDPHVIVCTHIFAAQIITHLKQKGGVQNGKNN